MRLHCSILTEACSCRQWNWPSSREKLSKNRLVCKNAVVLAYYRSCRPQVMHMGSWPIRTVLTVKPRPNDRNMPTQHVATLLGATCCVRLATVLRCVPTCWVLLAQVWNWSNLSQQHPTCRNTMAKRTQQVAPSNVATCCVGMLRSFDRGLSSKAFAFLYQAAANFLKGCKIPFLRVSIISIYF